MTQRMGTQVHACPRCGGAVCYTEPDEPFCLNCGHRLDLVDEAVTDSVGHGQHGGHQPQGRVQVLVPRGASGEARDAAAPDSHHELERNGQ